MYIVPHSVFCPFDLQFLFYFINAIATLIPPQAKTGSIQQSCSRKVFSWLYSPYLSFSSSSFEAATMLESPRISFQRHSEYAVRYKPEHIIPTLLRCHICSRPFARTACFYVVFNPIQVVFVARLASKNVQKVIRSDPKS